LADSHLVLARTWHSGIGETGIQGVFLRGRGRFSRNINYRVRREAVKKILRIDLDTQQYRYEESADSYKDLGGRGLTSKILSEEVSPAVDALGKENKLIFAPGILAGTGVPNSGRLSVGAKSPLTNTIKEANSGGAAAQKLARLHIQAVVVEGQGKELSSVKIDKSGVTFLSASHVKEMGNYELIETLIETFGDKVALITIGPAGERKYRTASVAVTSPDFQIRMASRGGLGAVMGSKNLKALIIDDTGGSEVEMKDPRTLKAQAAELAKGVLSHPLMEGLKQLGTPLLVNMINGVGGLPTRNYSAGSFEGAEAISGEHMVEVINKRPNGQPTHRCMNSCIIGCSNMYTDDAGKLIVSGLEYETLGLVGSNCMIASLDDVAWINRVCNDVGVDTMDIGAAIGVVMEAGLLPWGDGKGALGLAREIAEGTERGIMIASGCKSTGEQLGVKRIPQVKGQSLAAYDPRFFKGTGVTYATSTMGADHTCGCALPSPANPEYNPTAPTGQGPVSSFLQCYNAAVDTLGVCLFFGLPLLDMPDLQKHLIACAAAVTGEAVDENYLMKLGASVLLCEKKFNDAVGFTVKDDRLPEFFLREALPGSGLIFDVPEQELDSVFNF
jgi:aldehyde:ferredoxin oxidoreductase